MENSNEGIVCPSADSVQPFLTDKIPDDNVQRQKKGEKPINWDTRKAYSEQVGDILTTGEPHHQRQAQRIGTCSELLFFCWSAINEHGEIHLQFKKAYFCRVRNCPICQWRRSQMWVARFFQVLPAIYAAHPTMRYVLLTLTVQNCPVSELRSTVQVMSKAWKRLSERKAFSALGFVRSLEVTKETDTYDKKTKKLIHQARPNYCHPHFHIILALPASYFGGNYLSTAKWAALWQDALRSDYTPIVDVRLVKPKLRQKDDLKGVSDSQTDSTISSLQAAILETIKYTVKPSDMVQDREWSLALVDQLHKIRAVALGGIFKEFLQLEEDNEEKPDNDDQNDDQQDDANGLCFGWRQKMKRYQQLAAKN